MHDLSPLAGFFAPDVDSAMAALERRLGRQHAENAELMNSLRTGLRRELFELTHRTLVAQYGLIEKTVPFTDYVAALSDVETRAFITGRYPVLSRWIGTCVERWTDNVLELLGRFDQDCEELMRDLVDRASDQDLRKIRFGMGDAHRGGKTVAILHFADARVVYKPRSLAVDEHFAGLVQRVGEATGLDLRTPRRICRPDYGWVEFVEHEPCRDEREVDAYYERLGAFLALLYVLEATDFHYENVIAHGSHPMLIDLETFFHPLTPITGTETNEAFDSSVLRTGLLPNRILLGNAAGSDISGMSDVQGQEGVVERLVLDQDDGGRFRFRRERGVLVGGQNVPMLEGRPVKLKARWADRLKSGFSLVYRHIASDGPGFLRGLAEFGGDEVRVLFRNTVVYTHLLDEARHPALLLSEDSMGRHLSSLARLSRDFGLGDVLLEHEIRSLQGRDVPMFSCRVGDTALIIDGERSLPSFFVKSGLETVAEKVALLGEDDLARQIWIIDRSLELESAVVANSVAAPRAKALPAPSLSSSAGSQGSIRARYLRQATLIADHICGSVHQDDNHANWLVMKSASDDNSRMSVSTAFYDLYGGMPGEIAFLTWMGKVTGRSDYQSVADKAYRYLMKRVDAAAYSIRPLGLFGGWGSMLYLQTALGAWTGEKSFFHDAEELLARVDFEELLRVDRNFSLIKGAAGLLFACAQHHLASGSARALDLGRIAFDHLISHQHDPDGHLCWRIASAVPLSGLSHGASGFAASFAKMYEATGISRYREACLGVLEFERTLYDEGERNWLDRRDYTVKHGGPASAISWAHGAPGIGIARMSIISSGIEDEGIADDLKIALETTLAAGLGGELAVISGDFGRLELPLLYAEFHSAEHWSKTAEVLEVALGQVEDYTADLDVKRTAPLGLLAGLTGVGYQCLRIGGDDVPSLIGMSLRVPEKHLDLELAHA